MPYQFLEAPSGRGRGHWPQLSPVQLEASEIEHRLVGAFLGTLYASEPFLRAFLDFCGLNGGTKKACVAAETIFENKSGQRSHPVDGYISLPGRFNSSHLILEAKRRPFGNAEKRAKEAKQLQRYFDIAAEHGIDRVLTLSACVPDKDFVSEALGAKKPLASQFVSLSWMNTIDLGFDALAGLSDPRERWLIEQYIRSVMAHARRKRRQPVDREIENAPNYEIEFSSMGDDWRWLVQEFELDRPAPEYQVRVRSCIKNWYSLIRMMALLATTDTREDPVSWAVDVTPLAKRIEAEAERLLQSGKLSATITLGTGRAPNAVEIIADVKEKVLTFREKRLFRKLEEFDARLVRSLQLKEHFNHSAVENHLLIRNGEGQVVKEFDADRTSPLSAVFKQFGKNHQIYNETRVRLGLDMAEPEYLAGVMQRAFEELAGQGRTGGPPSNAGN